VRVPPLTGPNAFVDLGVPASLAAVLAAQEITEPTPIQALTIPAALAGHDVLGRGRTGSGKTLSFGLPMLVRLAGPRGLRRQPRGLILAPTRELAMQVVDALRPLAQAHALRVQLVIGGSSYDRQIRGLERADIVVATPGRLVDLAERGAVDLGAVQMVVLDEADHMADLGFMPEIEAIMGRLPEGAQGLLFSATLDADVDRLVRTYLNDPVEHSADPATATVGTMEHHLVLHVDPPHGPKEYLHRSGRTARAGASGTVISLATLRQQRMVHAITAKAGVTPAVLRARPGDDALRTLVG
jgi:superfamily II DNA/RNA helicase